MQPALSHVASHLRHVIAAIINADDPVWPSVIDVRHKKFPVGEHIPQRVYRLIGAPRGSTLYWDQPLVLSAYALSAQNGDVQFAQAADAYVQTFLKTCVNADSMFRWGNHQYYDVFEQKIIEFHNGYHELRPITPAWDVFWRHDAALTEAYIRRFSELHVYDKCSGGFNRHDDQAQGHAFIEAGGIIVESLAWLYQKTNDESLLQQALKIAGYSFKHRGADTALLCNEPDHGRWDSKVATTETGVWAQSMLRAYDYTQHDEFLHMAATVSEAYIDYGFDNESQQYFGQLDIESGAAVSPESNGYWPGTFANAWNTDQWPSHDYLIALGEACIRLSALTGKPMFAEAVNRIALVLMRSRPQQGDEWTYAEHYGRCIHFLCHAADNFNRQDYRADALVLADEARRALFEAGMFQGYHRSGVYESVDGVGYLLLSLLYLENGSEPALYGFGY